MPTINLGNRKKRDPAINIKKYQDYYQDKRWKRLRAVKVANDPVCERCRYLGLIVPTEEVHHIIPFQSATDPADIERLAFDYDNLQSLCITCHKLVDNKIRKAKY